MEWWQHLIVAVSWIALGFQLRSIWRAFKTKTRHVIPWREIITDKPETLHAMTMTLRLEVARKDKEIERLKARLAQ